LENEGSSPKKFSLEIPAKSYQVFNLSSSMFNNDGDSVRLLDFNKILKDDFEYDSSLQGKTWGRTDFLNNNFCLQEQSYSSPNNSCLIPSLTPTTKILPTTIIPTTKPTKYNLSRQVRSDTINPTLSLVNNSDDGEVLGMTVQKNTNDFLLIQTLSFTSFSYSLLTIIAVLFKINFAYGKGKTIFSSFVDSGRNQ